MNVVAYETEITTVPARPEGYSSGLHDSRETTWGFYVIAAYPVVFFVGLFGTVYSAVTTVDSSFMTTGLVGGYVFAGLSLFALVTYPAYRAEVVRFPALGEAGHSVRHYLFIGIGIPVVTGLLVELASLGLGGGLSVPGLLGAFVALVMHPIVIVFGCVFHLIRRRRYVDGGP